MKERPILFSGPMVRPILDGLKTQTRRVLREQPGKFVHVDFDDHRGWHLWWDCCKSCGDPDVWQEYANIACPYGKEGDGLWARETWAHAKGYQPTEIGQVSYPADWIHSDREMSRAGWRKRPSIHMPRWASRITLEVTSVRVERLNEISPEDCRAEGIQIPRCGCEVCGMGTAICPADASEYIQAYMQLWESINGTGSWAKNPWVWVIEFKRITP